MDPLTSIKLAELRRHELRVDAARALLAGVARRARRQRSRLDWLRGIVRRRPRYSGTPSARPAAVTSLAQHRSFDDLAFQLASNGPAAADDNLTRFVESAAARGATPSLLSVVADRDQPEVVRQRAFGRLAVELSTSMSDSARPAGKSDAA